MTNLQWSPLLVLAIAPAVLPAGAAQLKEGNAADAPKLSPEEQRGCSSGAWCGRVDP